MKSHVGEEVSLKCCGCPRLCPGSSCHVAQEHRQGWPGTGQDTGACGLCPGSFLVLFSLQGSRRDTAKLPPRAPASCLFLTPPSGPLLLFTPGLNTLVQIPTWLPLTLPGLCSESRVCRLKSQRSPPSGLALSDFFSCFISQGGRWAI